MATEFVRVKDPDTGHEVTVPKRFADGYKLEPLKDKPATNAEGRPLPGKPHVELKKADGEQDPSTETDDSDEAKAAKAAAEKAAADAAKAGSGRQSGGSR